MFKMRHYIEFKNPLVIEVNVNVNVTQRQDERVTQLEKQMEDWLIKLDEKLKPLEETAKQV